jgi:hypothetical protein
MKKMFLISSILFSSSFVFAQEIKYDQKSAVVGEAAYIVNGRFRDAKELLKIPQDSILSVNVVKRDTVINSKKYASQIFVILKKKDEEISIKKN